MIGYLRTVLAATVLVGLTTLPAQACGFGGGMVTETIVDRMLNGDRVVLARADPDNRFVFAVTETVRGPDGAAAIPLLVDSATRRRLDANPDDRVLLARDRDDGQWRRLAYLDPGFREVFDRIVPQLSAWQEGNEGARLQFFAGLYDHSDPRIGVLALTEMHGAPYELVRALDFDPSAETIFARLWTLSEAEFIPMRITLLGLSDDDAARDYLRQRIQGTTARGEALNLGATATALIEIDGIEGAEQIAGLLRDAALSAQEREWLYEALAVHNLYGEATLRAATNRIVGDLLRRDPSDALPVARQFSARGNWSQAGAVARAMPEIESLSPMDAIVLGQYVARAGSPQLSSAPSIGQ